MPFGEKAALFLILVPKFGVKMTLGLQLDMRIMETGSHSGDGKLIISYQSPRAELTICQIFVRLIGGLMSSVKCCVTGMMLVRSRAQHGYCKRRR